MTTRVLPCCSRSGYPCYRVPTDSIRFGASSRRPLVDAAASSHHASPVPDLPPSLFPVTAGSQPVVITLLRRHRSQPTFVSYPRRRRPDPTQSQQIGTTTGSVAPDLRRLPPRSTSIRRRPSSSILISARPAASVGLCLASPWLRAGGCWPRARGWPCAWRAAWSTPTADGDGRGEERE